MKNVKLSKRLIALLLCVAMLATLLTACSGGGEPAAGGGGESEGGYDLVYWTYSDMVLNDQGILMEQWVEEFVAENDDVNSVTVIAKDDADLLTSLMAGVGLPDMFCASARDAYNFRGAIDLLDLSSIYSENPEWAAGFYEASLEDVTIDGQQWAVPFMSFVTLVFRNKTVMEEAGIDWENEPLTTWDVFMDQCERVEAAGFDATVSWTTGHFTCPLGILGSDTPNLTIGVEDGKTTILPEQTVRSFETMLAMEEYSNGMTYGSQAATEAFKTNQMAFIPAGPWVEPDYIQSGVEYDIQLMPAYEEGGWTGGGQGQDWVYAVNSGDEGRNDAILRWMKKMGDFETQQAFTKVIGRSTLREDVMNDPEALTLEVAQVLSAGMEAGIPHMEFNHSPVFWSSAITDVAARLGAGEVTPEEASVEFIDAINALYAEAGVS